MQIGRTERYLMRRLEEKEYLHLTLLDPENNSPPEIARLAKLSEEYGTDAIMVGSSTLYSRELLDECIKQIKELVSVPVIIFPNNINAISKYADAIFFMSLLNSLEWWFIVGAQIHGSFLIKQYNLEAIPMGYLVFGSETAVATFGRAFPLPGRQGTIAAGYALAAQYLGMRFVYLEAGSGAASPIPVETVRAVRSVIDIPLMVGGGIRSPEQAKRMIEAGADVIVTGTLVEQDVESLRVIINAAKEGSFTRRRG